MPKMLQKYNLIINQLFYNLKKVKSTKIKVSKDYYMKISVSDPLGNTAADTQKFEVIDATLPVVTLLKPNPGFQILEYDTLDIEWSITDNHLLDSTWIYYSIDNLVNLIAVDSLKFDLLKYKYKITNEN